MDIKRSKLNLSVSVIFKIMTILVSLVTRRVLINTCGNDVNGVNALYLSIIGFLSVVELGVGAAITFCMYRPIVEGDTPKVCALYHLFKKAYLAIGAIIFTAGLLIMPFLKVLAKDYREIGTDLHLTFFLMLISVTATYLFSAKTSLFNAYKNNYVATMITQGGLLLQCGLQIVVLLVTKSFAWYLICRIMAVLVQYVCTEIIVRRHYPHIIKQRSTLDQKTSSQLKQTISAMFMHKIGAVLVNTVDSIVISAFVGVVALGEYSNYTAIMSAMTGVLTLVFTSLTSVIGHLCVEEDKETACRYCEGFHLLNFVLGTVFFLGYFAVIDNIIAILFMPELIVPKSISLVITVNGFIQYMRYSVLVFKDATGTFYHDRWKPLIEGVLNIILSVLLVHWVGVVGVIVATILTNLLICHVVEPYVLYKNAFDRSPRRYYLQNYSMMLGFAPALACLYFCMQTFENPWVELLINGCISVGISMIVSLVAIFLSKNKSVYFWRMLKKR